ncbi:hypothetical protein [Bacillus velezensis]|uniref:hypothetical protein n=1 Tax=Bacillus velezensis TaxID=492670 RepID=UPI003EBA856A
MIQLGSRQTPPYNDVPLKRSLQELSGKVNELADQVDNMDVSQEIKDDIETLKVKVQRLEDAESSGGTGGGGVTDNQLQSLRDDIASTNKLVQAHVSDKDKHVSNTDRANWNGFDERINTVSQELDTHKGDTAAHVSLAERTEWNNAAQTIMNGQQYPLTDPTGQRLRLDDGTDIFTAPTGFYYGINLTNTPLTGESAWYYIDISPAPNGMRKIVATRSASNETYIGTIHTDGNFRGWRKMMSENDFMKVEWYDLKLTNGAKQNGKKPQFARWGNLLMLKGDVSLTLGVAFASLPVTHSPYDKKAVLSTVYGTTGESKMYIDTDGSMTMVGFSGNDQSKISAWSLDLAVPY